MKLSFIFSQLEGSELRQLSLVDQSTGKLRPDKYKTVVDALNLGLVELYGKFLLKIGQVRVPIDPAREVYDLREFDRQVGAKMIQIHAINDQHGHAIPFNDFTNRQSVHFTTKTTMHVPQYLRHGHGVSEITIQYKSMPRQISQCDENVDPDYEDVDLDYQYVKALVLYVASRMHNPVGLQDATYQPNTYFGLYQQEVQRLEDENFELSYVAYDDKLHLRGWP